MQRVRNKGFKPQKSTASSAKRGLKNPVAATVATSALNSDTGKKVVENTGNFIKNALIITLGIGLIGGFIYIRSRQFKKLALNKDKPAPSITETQAEMKAEAIYNAMYGIGNGFTTVKNNLSGVNHNGFIMIYNAFGKRVPATTVSIDPFNTRGWNLIEWISNEFSDSEKNQLRFLVGNGFF